MTSMPLGPVVAKRELEFRTVDGQTQPVSISLGKPVQDEGGPWLCSYLIEGRSFRRQFRMAGEDSMQALFLAQKTIMVELEVLARANHGSFTWLGDSNLGFAP
jgi:hypothetical protein